MAKRVAVVLVLIILVTLLGGIALIGTAKVTQTGTSSGLSYRFSSSGLRNYSFIEAPSGFRYSSATWIGTSPLDVTINGTSLSINGRPAGTVQKGDTLEITTDQHVFVNGSPRP